MARDKIYTARVEITDSEGVTYSVPLADLSDEVRNEIRATAKDSLDNILQDSIESDVDDFVKEPARTIESHVSSYSHDIGMPYSLNNLEGTAKSELRETLTSHVEESKDFSALEIEYLLEFVDAEGEFITERKGKIYNSLREKNYEILTSDRNRLVRKFDGNLIEILPSEGPVKRGGHLATLTSEGKQFVSELRTGLKAFEEQMDKRLYVLDMLSEQSKSNPGYVSKEKRRKNLIDNVPFSEEVVDGVIEDLKTNGYIRTNGLTPINKGKTFLETFRERIDYLNQSEAVVEEIDQPEENLLVSRLRDRTYSRDDLNELEELLKVEGISNELSTAIRTITAYDGLPEEDKKFMDQVYEANVEIFDEHYSPAEEGLVDENNLSKEEIRAIVEELIDPNQEYDSYDHVYSDARLANVPKKSIVGHVAWAANPDSFKRD